MTTPLGTAAGSTVLRLAWLSDMHVRQDAKSVEGFTRALLRAQSLQQPIAAILNGGDCVFDSLKADWSTTQMQWQAFHDVLSNHLHVPIYHCIGNHDIWGWGRSDPGLESDPLYGIRFAMKELGLQSPYYSFDLGGWHFIVLNSTHPSILPPGAPYAQIPYTARLDDGQFAWLSRELDTTPAGTPICILSHIPLFSTGELLDGPNETSGNWVVPGAWVHIDARRIVNLFHAHPNVRVCLSGHTHEYGHMEFAGHDDGDRSVQNHSVSYWANGAVSGGWWRGSHIGFPPAIVAVNLHSDGSADTKFIPYEEVPADPGAVDIPPQP